MKHLLFILFLSSSLLAQHDSTIVLLSDIDSTIVQDVKYATTDNFTGKVLYEDSRVYIRKIVGENLSKANKYLQEKYGYTIKIFDGFRPRSVQRIMWEIYPNPSYVANPATGSRHNRGAAVDISFVTEDGKEADMGTEYDNFTKKAHSDYQDLTELQLKNRKILREAMEKFEFKVLSSEWWHFDFKGWSKFSILD